MYDSRCQESMRAAGSSTNQEGDRTGGVNKILDLQIHPRGPAKRDRKRCYVTKWTIFAVILAAIFVPWRML